MPGLLISPRHSAANVVMQVNQTVFLAAKDQVAHTLDGDERARGRAGEAALFGFQSDDAIHNNQSVRINLARLPGCVSSCPPMALPLITSQSARGLKSHTVRAAGFCAPASRSRPRVPALPRAIPPADRPHPESPRRKVCFPSGTTRPAITNPRLRGGR